MVSDPRLAVGGAANHAAVPVDVSATRTRVRNTRVRLETEERCRTQKRSTLRRIISAEHISTQIIVKIQQTVCRFVSSMRVRDDLQ